MQFAFKYPINYFSVRRFCQAVFPKKRSDHGDHLAQTTNDSEFNVVSVNYDAATTINTGAEEAERSKRKKGKADLAPVEIGSKKIRMLFRWKVIIGLVGPISLDNLDSSIIAAAIPYIASDFKEIKQLNWIIAAFNLPSAASLPVWAQLNDIFGRHLTIQAAIIVVMVGSAVCTAAPTSAFGVFIFGRALQGAGTAGLNISIRTILADRVSLSDYSFNWTITSVIAGISFSIGPVVGGYLTLITWRWCFAILLPIALAAIVLILVLLRKELLGPQTLQGIEGRDTSTRCGRLLARLSTIDYCGQMLFLGGLGLLCLALTWGGGTYPWSSVAVLVPLILGGALSISWVLYEHSMSTGLLMSRIFPLQKAMMPWELLSHRDIGLIVLIYFAVGMTMVAVTSFMSLYFKLVEGKNSSETGVALLFYLPGLGTGVFVAMFSSNFWPRQTLPALLLGGMASAVGITVLAWAIHAENKTVIKGMMALIGYGVGIRMNPGSLHCLAYFPTKTAAIACLVTFAMTFGSLVGLTLMLTVFINKSGYGRKHPKEGIMWSFIVMTPFMWMCVLLTTFLGNVWISRNGGHEIVNGAHLWSYATGKKLTRERVVLDNHVNLAPVDATRQAGNDV